MSVLEELPDHITKAILAIFPEAIFATLPAAVGVGNLVIYTNEPPPKPTKKYRVSYSTTESFTGYVLAESEKQAVQKAIEEEWEMDPESEGDTYPEEDSYYAYNGENLS